jgi:murein DD-endopeptidase MepM/ murein hydrolase activator NlpD
MARQREFQAYIVGPSATSKLRKVRISYRTLYRVAAAFSFVVLIGVIGAFRLAQHISLEFKLASLARNNDRLQMENEALRTNYERLNGRIAHARDLTESLAREVRHEKVAEVDATVGQGGPDAPDNISIPDLDQRLESLEREIRTVGDAFHDEQLRLATVPVGLPVQGYLTDSFGGRRSPFGGGGTEDHEGQDIAAPYGAPVQATADGLVVYAAARAGYGNVVVVYHGNGLTTRFGHLSQIGVQAGQRIRRGVELGKVGSTGRSTGPHCHYEVRQNNVPLDPMTFAGE